jgi:hypothetical protein
VNVYQNQFDERQQTSAYWHNRSHDLLVSARTLSKAMEDDKRLEVNCLPSYKMLIGMSFELLLKCHCIAAETSFRPTHDLVELARTANLRVSKHEIEVLKILSAFIIWDGRYPIPKTVKMLEEHWKHQNDFLQGDELDFEKLLPIWRRFSDLYLEKQA